jgi:hypothetical protein
MMSMAQAKVEPVHSPIPGDVDPSETAEWLESLDYVLESKGPERVQQLLSALEGSAHRNGIDLPFTATTPYVNTIPRDRQPQYPGQTRPRAPDQKHRSLECDGDGHAGEPRSCRHRRPYLDVRFVGQLV